MINRRLSLFFVLFYLFYFCAPSFSQPLLPDLSGNTQNGYAIVSWTSQYDALKSISVQRSADSVYNYSSIGYVKATKKGVQAYIDGHPLPGKNWYRLYIVFNSDLTWYSNRMMIYVDSAQLLKQQVMAPNDSLQQYVPRMIKNAVAASAISPPPANKNQQPVTTNTQPPAANNRNTTSSNTTTTVATKQPAANNRQPATTNTNSTTQPHTANNTTAANNNTTAIAPPPEPPIIVPKLVLTLPDASGVDAYAYVKSQFVFTNPFTGHVNVEIRDAKQYHYSLWFYDSKEARVLEIPSITQPAIIIDKRNFSHKGLYRFELIRDREKLESGFITIY